MDAAGAHMGKYVVGLTHQVAQIQSGVSKAEFGTNCFENWSKSMSKIKKAI